jgi:hypothetical protein
MSSQVRLLSHFVYFEYKHDVNIECDAPGTDVMIIYINIFQEKWQICVQNTSSFIKIYQKLVKIAENLDHNIDPCIANMINL